MRSHLTRLAGQTLVYGIGGVAVQLVGVLTLPVFARVFAPAQYGVIEVITVSITIGAVVVDAGLQSASQRSYYDYPEEEGATGARGTVLSTAILTSLAISLVVATVIVGARDPLAKLLVGDPRYGDAIAIAGATLPFAATAALTREVMRLRFRPWPYLASTILAAGGGAVAGIVAVVALDLGVKGVFIGTLTGAAASLTFGVFVSGRYVGRQFSRRELRVMLAYGLPLVPTALAVWALQFVDRLMLSKLSDLSEVGQYAIANRVSLPLLLVVTAFATAYSPYLLSLHAEDAELEREVRGRVLTYLVTALVVAGCALSLFARELISIIAPRFDDAYHAVGLLAVGLVAYGACAVTMAGISLTRRTSRFAAYSAAAAAVNVALNFVLIPAWGMEGAAVSTAIAYLLLSALYYRTAQRLSPTPYEKNKLVRLALLAAVVMPIGAVPLTPGLTAVLLKLAALAALLVGLRATGVLSSVELGELRRLIRSLVRREARQA